RYTLRAALPLAQKLSVAEAVHVPGSLVPSRQKRAWIVVPLARRRTHQREPAAPEAASVPWASVTVFVPPPLATRISAQLAAPEVVCVMRATYPLRASVWARAMTRAW